MSGSGSDGKMATMTWRPVAVLYAVSLASRRLAVSGVTNAAQSLKWAVGGGGVVVAASAAEPARATASANVWVRVRLYGANSAPSSYRACRAWRDECTRLGRRRQRSTRSSGLQPKPLSNRRLITLAPSPRAARTPRGWHPRLLKQKWYQSGASDLARDGRRDDRTEAPGWPAAGSPPRADCRYSRISASRQRNPGSTSSPSRSSSAKKTPTSLRDR
jgi:hypothetical protein